MENDQDFCQGSRFLTMCSVCHGIRQEEEWLTIERFLLLKMTDIQGISHSLCPACAIEHYGQFL
ncbi:MAG: hypothetical protein FJ135_17025 [Deltaproteobacteria bacterium]|nr:hypothetical protein [Deltaproteobacteria bacterium]